MEEGHGNGYFLRHCFIPLSSSACPPQLFLVPNFPRVQLQNLTFCLFVLGHTLQFLVLSLSCPKIPSISETFCHCSSSVPLFKRKSSTSVSHVSMMKVNIYWLGSSNMLWSPRSSVEVFPLWPQRDTWGHVWPHSSLVLLVLFWPDRLCFIASNRTMKAQTGSQSPE